jgi:SAM-dependent methyltransferase
MSLPYDYNKLSEYYEVLEGGKTDATNLFLGKLLKKYKAKKILDLTCGTGAQTLWLAKHGYDVVGADISPDMLKLAKENTKKANLKIKLYHGDMRTSRLGTFDAVITIFNAIGHLTKPDFEKAIRNIGINLKDDGIYIFDIFNLDFMKENFINYRFIDVATESNDTKFVRFNKNRLDGKNGVMIINQETFVQKGLEKPKVFKEQWTMQIYTPKQLKNILNKNGFEVLGQHSIDAFRLKGNFVLTVARKRQ